MNNDTRFLLKMMTPDQIAEEANEWIDEYCKGPGKVYSKPLVSTEAKVKEIVSEYRRKPPPCPWKVTITEDPTKLAKTIVNVTNVTRYPFHIGKPKEEMDKIDFFVSHKLLPKYGELFRFRLYKCNPETDLFVLLNVLEKTTHCETGILVAELDVPLLIDECQKLNETVLQILIEGTYRATSDGPPLKSFSRRIELWNETDGIHFMPMMMVSTWPLSFEDKKLEKHGKLLHAPDFTEQNRDFRFNLQIMEVDNPFKPEFYDYEGYPEDSKSHPMYYDNQTFQTEVDKSYHKQLEETTKLISAKKVVYNPSCGTNFADLGCVMCKEKFPNVVALILHLHNTYVKLRFKLQRIPYSNGNSDLLIHLFVADVAEDAGREFGRKDLFNPKVWNEKIDIPTLLMKAFSSADIFRAENQIGHRMMEHWNRYEEHALICSECRMIPNEWPAYAGSLTDFDYIVNTFELPFDSRFFWACFHSFKIKSRAIPLFHEWDFTQEHRSLVEKIYIYLRVFLYTHTVILKNDTVKFVENFIFLLDDVEQLFCLKEDFTDVFKNDLRARALNKGEPNKNYLEDKPFKCMYKQNELRQEQFGTCSPYLLGPIPKTPGERRAVIQKISLDPETIKMFPYVLTFREDMDFFRIPRCLFFGADAQSS